ncbi:aldo/keto reductase [Bartonella sp. HY329]|uniref:aldo/keto reductase n=1 Tax=unclassified Bartonella TaxID=2645622 RepID=UPI0021C96B35|nr:MULTISPECIES: aldo/keto reductase [unclassified Bartonella]UXM94787.1 aldo/keto reductase [Bartonella sp. HY329]UXN09110.1 aldo/keto reductase [Bartonella sp. HY328]
MKTATLPNGICVPALGQGTWGMGEGRQSAGEEADALRHGIQRGLTLIDTAEMYGDGGAERVVGEAMQGFRDDIFLVDKVLPSNGCRQRMQQACERSLRNLDTDYIDLYLLHWRGAFTLEEVVETFEDLKSQGKIKHWGVSNFDIADMEELQKIAPSNSIITDQVLYNLLRRGIEYDLMPWCESNAIPIMAYSPIEQARILKYPQLQQLAKIYRATPAAIALAFVLRKQNIIAIPKASDPIHIDENLEALSIQLTEDDLALLDRVFSAPTSKTRLEML